MINIIRNNAYLFNIHKPSSSPNVIIISLPRSGSTYLMELIWSQPKFKYANEPLNLSTKWLQEKSGINGFDELYSLEVKDKLIRYFEKIVIGKYHFLNPNPLRHTSRILTSRIVFKVIHGGELFINDLASATNSRIVYLIRNPVAVALSRKKLPRIKQLTSELVLSKFNMHERNLAIEIFEKGNELEKRIVAWCIQNKLALDSRKDDWLVISYEELLLNHVSVITEIAKHCDLPIPETMFEKVSTPSAVTVQSNKNDVNLMKGSYSDKIRLIRKWRDRLSSQQIKRCFEICRLMNFGVYNECDDLPKKTYLVSDAD